MSLYSMMFVFSDAQWLCLHLCASKPIIYSRNQERCTMSRHRVCVRPRRPGLLLWVIVAGWSARVSAQSPWERAANNLALTFTGPVARALALVAIVIGGLMLMFGEAGAKRQISGIVFGGGLALFAGQFLIWLF